MLDDADLLKAARKLDHDALKEIFERYAVPLFKYSIRLCGDAHIADDIVGEVFEQLLLLLSDGKGPRDNLRSYLYQIAYHKVIDQIRDHKYEVDLDPYHQSEIWDSPQNQSENHEQVKFLEQIIQDDLTEDQRNIVILRFVENFSLKETAEITGKEIGNVKVIQSRAISRIRQRMGSSIEDLL